MRRILYGVSIFCLCTVLVLGAYGYQKIQMLEGKLANLEESLNHREQELLEVMASGISASQNENSSEEAKQAKELPVQIYYLKELNGRVMVYREDKSTLFEPTQISVSSLPEKLKKEITQGKYLPSEEALYSFLENYSS